MKLTSHNNDMRLTQYLCRACLTQALACAAGRMQTHMEEHEEHNNNPTLGEDKDLDEGNGQSLPDNDVDGSAD